MNFEQLLPLIVVVTVALLIKEVLRSPAVIGAIGEWKVRRILRKNLSPDYKCFNDLTVPSGDGTTQIDHIVIARTGVFVIETKNMSGWIFGSAKQASWTQSFGGKNRKFQNPLRQNYKHVKAITDLLGVDSALVHSLVAFVGTAKAKTEMPDNVCWTARELLAEIGTHSEPVLSDAEVQRLETVLIDPSFRNNRAQRRAHVQHVREVVERCPKCGSDLVLRENRKTGTRFMGCSTFPKCRGKRPAP